jgi:hypothetical protein
MMPAPLGCFYTRVIRRYQVMFTFLVSVGPKLRSAVLCEFGTIRAHCSRRGAALGSGSNGKSSGTRLPKIRELLCQKNL